MNIEVKERFTKAYEKYFPNCELPIACFYSDELNNAEFPNSPKPSFLTTDNWSKIKSRF